MKLAKETFGLVLDIGHVFDKFSQPGLNKAGSLPQLPFIRITRG
jgi:hypothetical protein